MVSPISSGLSHVLQFKLKPRTVKDMYRPCESFSSLVIFCAADTPRQIGERSSQRFSSADVYAFPFKLKLHSGQTVAFVGIVRLSAALTSQSGSKSVLLPCHSRIHPLGKPVVIIETVRFTFPMLATVKLLNVWTVPFWQVPQSIAVPFGFRLPFTYMARLADAISPF